MTTQIHALLEPQFSLYEVIQSTMAINGTDTIKSLRHVMILFLLKKTEIGRKSDLMFMICVIHDMNLRNMYIIYACISVMQCL